jgi:Ca2+-binding RTX toxin-like protein
MAVYIDINDFDNNAFTLTVYDEISATLLLDRLIKSALLTPEASKLLGQLDGLLKFAPITLMSFDSIGDDKLDPLVNFVPLETEIAGTSLDLGMGINAKVTVFGAVGTLALFTNPAYTYTTGSLTIENLKINNILTISGIAENSDLTANFHISALGIYFNGDGKFTVGGFTLAQAQFKVTPTIATITDSFLAAGPLVFHINSLSVVLAELKASGETSITLFNQIIADASFYICSDHFDTTFTLFGATATAALDINNTSQAISGSLSIDHLAINGFLSISGVTAGTDLTLSFDTINPSLSGSGRIALFDYTLAAAKFDYSEQAVNITDATLALVPSVITLNINTLNVDLVLNTSSGNADIGLFGNTLANTAFNISTNHVDFKAAITLGAISVIDSFVWNNATNTLTGTSTIKINNTSLANASFSYSEGSVVTITGELAVTVKEGVGSVNASITATYNNDTKAVSVTVDADLGALGDVHFSVNANDFTGKYIAAEIYNLAVSDLGELPDYIASAVTDGVTGILKSGSFSFTKAQATNAVDDALNQVGSKITKWFGGSKEHNQTFIDDDTGQTWDGNGGNDVIFGNGGNDDLHGHQGNDIIDGGAGNDKLQGGSGDDVVYGGDGNDVIQGYENLDLLYGGQGNDTIYGDWFNGSDPSASYDDEIHGGAGNDSIYGDGGNDTIYGDGGNDTLDGGVGIDRLIGGSGNDTYYVDNTGDVVTETSTLITEIDTVNSSITYTLEANLENLTLTGTAALNGTGNALDNTLIGNSAANTLIGGAGVDMLIGGSGNDTYYVDNISDVIIETSTLATESDSVFSSVTYTLSNNVEKLTLTGSAALNGTGNASTNVITGTAGADTLIGGLGNDIYVVDNSGDVVSEIIAGGGGTDTVNSSISYTLGANLENLTLTGTAALNGTGNASNNVLTGNAGANTLDGGAGADTLIGGADADTFVFSASNNGFDTISDLQNEDGITVAGATFSGIVTTGNGSKVGKNEIQFSTASGMTTLFIGTDLIAGADVQINISGTYAADAFTLKDNLIYFNDAPTLTAFASTVASGNEDSPIEVTFTSLQAPGNEADIDGSVTAFVVRTISTGSLTIGISLATATPWNVSTNNTIDAAHQAYWTPALNANGSLEAFTVVARDDGNLLSAMPIPITVAVTAANDAPTGIVTITGTATQNQVLTAANTLADVDGLGTITYQWLANGTAITGATASTLTLAQTQVGKTITVQAAYTDLLGTAEKVTSSATTSVVNVNDLPTGIATITGTATQKQVLTATNTLADIDGLGTIKYQWLANGTAITGATAATLTLAQTQVGKTITVQAAYTDLLGIAEKVTSSATTSVVNVNDPPVLIQPTAISYTDTAFDDTFATATGSLSASDIDGNVLTYGITGGINNGAGAFNQTSAYGMLTVSKVTGAYSFVTNDAAINALNAPASTSFTVTASDGLLSDSKTLTINMAQLGVTESIGNDTLTGTTGNDKINGLAGNDTLIGGLGIDLLTGGIGSDTFVFKTSAESVEGLARDAITDFTHSQGDRIDLAGIDANTLVVNDQAFTYIGAMAFTGVAGQLDYVNGILAGDSNGDKVADFEIVITLVGGTSLVSADFVL